MIALLAAVVATLGWLTTPSAAATPDSAAVCTSPYDTPHHDRPTECTAFERGPPIGPDVSARQPAVGLGLHGTIASGDPGVDTGAATATYGYDSTAALMQLAHSGRWPSTGRVAAKGGGALVDASKYDYLFGNVASNAHNAARPAQNAQQLARIGVHNNAAGRSLLQGHFDDVIARNDNIARTFSNEHGAFQIRDSLFSGPGGFLKLESTWQVTGDGLRLTTVIPMGACDECVF